VEAEVVNISRGGVSVECSEKLEEGKVYTVKMFLRDAVFDVKCCVVWTLDNGSGTRFRSGMKFVQTENNRAEDLGSYIEECRIYLGKRFHHRANVTRARALLRDQ
jgi:hypothetical protein